MYAIGSYMQMVVVISGVVLAVLLFAAGLKVKAHGDYFLAVRETALNTRKDAEGSQYKGLLIESKLHVIFGWIIMVGGPLLALASVAVYIANS